jgi:hypothetical protein
MEQVQAARQGAKSVVCGSLQHCNPAADERDAYLPEYEGKCGCRAQSCALHSDS